MELDLKLTSKEINHIMWQCGKTLSTAESCTAGRIASAITAVPGSSTYFKGGLICYANEIKTAQYAHGLQDIICKKLYINLL